MNAFKFEEEIKKLNEQMAAGIPLEVSPEIERLSKLALEANAERNKNVDVQKWAQDLAEEAFGFGGNIKRRLARSLA